jgi:hypothetical protein
VAALDALESLYFDVHILTYTLTYDEMQVLSEIIFGLFRLTPRINSGDCGGEEIVHCFPLLTSCTSLALTELRTDLTKN